MARETKRLLVAKGIASFNEHETAAIKYWSLFRQEGGDSAAIRSQMSVRDWDLALAYRGWGSQDIGFSIQWVNGNYSDAEESFLRINSSGTNLSEWEIKLVRYRQSSFARLVTSIAYPEFIKRCWPRKNEKGDSLSTDEQKKAEQISQACEQIADLLWEPRDAPNGSRLRPLLVPAASEPGTVPLYVGELLTVVQGEAGRPTQTEDFMRRDKSSDSATLLTNGRTLTQQTFDALNHLRGRTNYSMGIVSAAYFYNNEGVAVRSLLYGFLFWINYGSKEEIRKRKQLFCAFRGAFEKVLLERKRELITRISRRSGSGGEVTIQTARYFNGLLELVVEHNTQTDTPEFERVHKNLLEEFKKSSSKPDNTNQPADELSSSPSDGGHNVVASRIATKTQKSRLQLEQEIKNMPRCGICGGLMLLDDPLSPPQFDHEKEHSQGGQTSDDNLRPTHPFCNQQRKLIEALKGNPIALPDFVDSQGRSIADQLTFLSYWGGEDDNMAEIEALDQDDEDETPFSLSFNEGEDESEASENFESS